jgi:hypothetical protein
MNSSELLRKRQQAANQYKSYWQPRDASEVTARNMYKANNTVVRTNYHPDIPAGGVSVVTANGIGRSKCDTAIGPGNGAPKDFSFTGVQNANAACAVCSDTTWSAAGGITLKTAQETSNILYEAPNPTQGLRWITSSSGTLVQALQGSCPPNNAAQNPKWGVADPKCC